VDSAQVVATSGGVSVDSYDLFVATLALFALLGAFVLVLPPVRRRLAEAGFSEVAPWLALLVALVATLGSLTYSEVVGFEPCRFCWYQRIAMYPLVPVIAVGAITRDPNLRRYVLPLSLIGAVISAYHYLIEWFPQLEGNACSATVPCSVRVVEVFGFVSIPFMALCGFLAISALVGLYPRRTS
jgi:disulfide bond formation protein DsbB